ncbi:MAG: CoA transferase [Acidimicrobiia bacterium]
MSALDGIRVLDPTEGIVGPMGVLLLAEHDADVVEVEPPGGLTAAPTKPAGCGT